jgi:hypothetical protein
VQFRWMYSQERELKNIDLQCATRQGLSVCCRGIHISKEMANIVFNKAACKVIKDAVKHAHLVSTALYYAQVLKQPIMPS